MKKIEIIGKNNRYQIKKCTTDKEEKTREKYKNKKDIIDKCNNNIRNIIPSIYFKIDSSNNILYDDYEKIVLQELITKRNSYIQQDKKHKSVDDLSGIISLEEIIEKILTSKYCCYYCKDEFKVLYDKVREKKQWTLERIDNNIGHTNNNCVIACFECNMKRRDSNMNNFKFTKQLKINKTF